jgi:hypothetical protein
MQGAMMRATKAAAVYRSAQPIWAVQSSSKEARTTRQEK